MSGINNFLNFFVYDYAIFFFFVKGDSGGPLIVETIPNSFEQIGKYIAI